MLKKIKITIKVLIILGFLGLIYFVYKETGFFTSFIITLIMLELWGRRQIESAIIKMRLTKKDKKDGVI